MDELEQVVARRMRYAMAADGLRQEDVAGSMTVLGFRWSANRVAQVVTGRGALSLLEIAGICATLGRPLSDLIGDSGEVELPAGTAIAIDKVREALVAGDPNPWHSARSLQIADALPRQGQHAEATVKAAKRLGVTPADVEVAAAELWGHSFPKERDRRAEPRAGESKRQLQARRGHAARTLLAELGDYFALPGRLG
jgi:transcriptional regulator with XRE-family HTH domain